MPTYRVQWIGRPYGPSERIPESAWHDYGRATTGLGLERVYRRAYRDTHPQQNAWTGHVRVLGPDGTPVRIGDGLEALNHPRAWRYYGA